MDQEVSITCLNNHNDLIVASAWSPREQILFTCTSNKATLHNFRNNTKLNLETTVNVMGWNCIGSLLAASNCKTQIVEVYTVEGKFERGLEGHNNVIRNLRWNVYGFFVAACGNNGSVTVWNALNCDIVFKSILSDGTTLTVLDWNSDHSFVAGCTNGKIYYYDIQNPKPVPSREFISHEPNKEIQDVKWNLEGNLLASRSIDNVIKLWTLEKKSCIKTIPFDNGVYPMELKWLPNESIMVYSLVNNFELYCYHFEYGILIKTLHHFVNCINEMITSTFSISPNGKLIASGCLTNTGQVFMTIFDTDSGRMLRKWDLNEQIKLITWNAMCNQIVLTTINNIYFILNVMV